MPKTHYNLYKAIKNPNKVEDLVIFLEEVKQEQDLEKIGLLTNLKKLALLDGKWLQSIPESIKKLKQLKELRIRATSIPTIPFEYINSNTLEVLDLESSPVAELSNEIGNFRKLKELNLSKLPLEKLPNTIGELSQLEKLHLNHLPKLKMLPPSVGSYTQLVHFCVADTPLESLPFSIGKWEKVQWVLIRGTGLKTLPTSIQYWGNVQLVSLKNNQLHFFPTAFCQCETLTHLYISGNPMRDLPQELEALKNLEVFHAQNIPFRKFPTVLLGWKNTWAKPTKELFQIDKNLYHGTGQELWRLLQSKTFSNFNIKEKKQYFSLYNKDNKQIAKLPKAVIRKATNIKINTIADHAVEHLTNGNEESLGAESKILVLGKLKKERLVLEQKLAAVGITLVSKIKSSFTHVLISARGNKRMDKLPFESNWKWITEAQVMAYVDQVNPDYIVASEQTKELEGGMVSQVKELIMTLGEDNMALAIELLIGGGFPRALVTEVFLVYKLSKIKDTQQKAKKLLEERADTNLRKVLRLRSSLLKKKSYYTRADYLKMNEVLLKYTYETPIDLGLLAYGVYFKTNGLGLTYALTYAPSKYKKQLISHLLKGEDLFYLDYYQTLEQFPEELTEFSQLKAISIYGKYSSTVDFVIPASIHQLTNLEELHIRYVYIKKVPVEALVQMKQLKSLSFRTKEKIDIEQLEQALPNCKIDIKFR